MLSRREVLTTCAALSVATLPSLTLAVGTLAAGTCAAGTRAAGTFAAGRRGRDQRRGGRDGRLRLANGRYLGYREFGHRSDGPLVFYFHGIPGSRLEIDLCGGECFDSEAHIVAVDRPGMGRSSYYGNRRIKDWPGDIEALAAGLGHAKRPFGIISHSSGAPYAAACAHQIPHRLTHVAIVSGHAPVGAGGTCPGNYDDLIKLIARRPRLSKLALKFMGRRLARKPDKVVQKVVENWSAADKRLILCNPTRYRQLIANLREANRCGPAGLIKDIRLLAGCWGFRLRDIRGVPVSIWQGGCDPVVTPSMGHYFQQQIAGSELFVDPRAGHVTMFLWHAGEILSRFAG